MYVKGCDRHDGIRSEVVRRDMFIFSVNVRIKLTVYVFNRIQVFFAIFKIFKWKYNFTLKFTNLYLIHFYFFYKIV